MNEFTYIDEDSIRSVVKELSTSSNLVDTQMARYLDRAVDVWTGNRRDSDLSQTPMEHLGLVVMMSGLSDSSEKERRGGTVNFSQTSRWAVMFITKFFHQLHEIICGPKKEWSKVSLSSQGWISALVTILMNTCHIPYATAKGFAVLILVSIGRAGKKAFCESTEEEVLDALARS